VRGKPGTHDRSSSTPREKGERELIEERANLFTLLREEDSDSCRSEEEGRERVQPSGTKSTCFEDRERD